MDKKNEIESELLLIKEKYQRDFSLKLDKSKDALSSMAERLTLMSKLSSEMTDELIESANKHLEKYDIDDASETETFIQTCYLDFFEFAKSVD